MEGEIKKHIDASVGMLEEKVMAKLNEIEQLIKIAK